ncbi:MAG: hypothetical protein ACJ797_10795 [Ktedonobacteraceae bacterium]
MPPARPPTPDVPASANGCYPRLVRHSAASYQVIHLATAHTTRRVLSESL